MKANRFIQLGLALLAFCSLQNARANGGAWVTSWGASPQPQKTNLRFANQTLLEVVHLSLGGSSLRVHLSNLYGDGPLEISRAQISINRHGTKAESQPDGILLFNHQTAVSIPAGQEIVSDALALPVANESNLTIALFLSGAAPRPTFHAVASQTSWALQNNQSTPLSSWYYLDGVDVLTNAAFSIVTLGDSITDGMASTLNANQRWPDFFAQSLLQAGLNASVINEGISFNRVLLPQPDLYQPSDSALTRLNRDVLAQNGVRYLVVLEGINDINLSDPNADAEEFVQSLILGYQEIITKAHRQGIKVAGATLTPFGGLPGATPNRHLMRDLVNNWIRTSGAYDTVIDFDEVLRDANDPQKMNAKYDSGDHIHPNSLGYQAMGQSVDLSFFK